VLSDKALTRAQGTIENAMRHLQERFPMQSEPQRQRLTKDQQLELFMNMSDGDLEILRQKKGDAEFKRYVEAMLRLARSRGYGATL